MEFSTHLSKTERTLLKRVIQIQIDSMTKILTNETMEDIRLLCLVNHWDYDVTLANMKRHLIAFEELHDCPTKFLRIEKKYLKIIKHILVDFIDEPEELDPKQSLFRKIHLFEDLVFNEN